MKSHLNIEESLWNYIDGNCNAEDESYIRQLLEFNQEWKSKYKELLEIHQLMQDSVAFEGPSMRFTQNVMDNISKLQVASVTKNYINTRTTRGIAFVLVVSLIGLLIYGVIQVNWSAPGDTNVPAKINNLHLNFNALFNTTYTTIFMMVNTVLALILFDMYLGKQKRQHQRSQQ